MPCMQLTCASLPKRLNVAKWWLICLMACVRPWICISRPLHARRSLILITTQDNRWTWYTHAWADTILLILAQVWSRRCAVCWGHRRTNPTPMTRNICRTRCYCHWAAMARAAPAPGPARTHCSAQHLHAHMQGILRGLQAIPTQTTIPA